MAWLNPHYFWTLLFVPLAVVLLLWAAWQRRKAHRAFGDVPLVARLTAGVSSRRRRWKGAILTAGIALLALALAGPRIGTKLREVKREGLDLVIALDVSLSMQAEDVSPNRLQRAKNEVKKLLEGLKGDRVGLVLFAGDAFIQCPLTTDFGAVRLFLDVADPSMIPTPGTNFTAATQMAIRAFESVDEKARTKQTSRAVLVISDGENHVGDVDALAREFREAGVTVFTAGVGETSGVPIPLYTRGRLTGYKRNEANEVVSSRLEEDALKALGRNGAYFRIARTSSTLSQLPDVLDRMEKTEFSADVFEEYEERYQWPLALGLLLLLVESLIVDRRKKAEEPNVIPGAIQPLTRKA